MFVRLGATEVYETTGDISFSSDNAQNELRVSFSTTRNIHVNIPANIIWSISKHNPLALA